MILTFPEKQDVFPLPPALRSVGQYLLGFINPATAYAFWKRLTPASAGQPS